MTVKCWSCRRPAAPADERTSRLGDAVAGELRLTGNLQKAASYGTEVVQEPSFLATIGIDPAIVGRVSQRWAQQ